MKMSRRIINLKITETNEVYARRIRQITEGLVVINLLGSPGSGKTTLIELMAGHLEGIAVIEGDLESDIDKERLESAGLRAYQINTHSGCHLTAKMVLDAVNELDLSGIRFLIIENVGNLVCPANIDIGQDINIVVSSVIEGHDKPKKYPIIFRNAQIVVLSKYDLSMEFEEEQFLNDLKEINKDIEVFRVSKKDRDSASQLSRSLASLIKG